KADNPSENVSVVEVALRGNGYAKVSKWPGESPCQVPEKLLDALVKLSMPEKTVLSPRSVDEAAVTVSAASPRVSVAPFRMMVECARPALLRVPEIAGVTVIPLGETANELPNVRPL